MRLSLSLKDKLMDVRLREKLLAEGKITQKELDAYLNGLSDDGSNATYTESHEAAQASEEVSPTPTH